MITTVDECTGVDGEPWIARIERLELARTDWVYLNALGAQRIPDPTTEGDFYRHFTPEPDPEEFT